MILEITKLPEETEEENIYEKLIEDFNKIAKEMNSKYRLTFYFNYPKLSKPIFKILNNYVSDCIFYMDNEDYFYFYGGIDEEIFNDIRQILEKINLPQKFKIELK